MRKVSFIRAQGATWVATYGSVTFNQFGRDNPMTGINEKGLMVSQMWLDETRYPPADTRPVIGNLEWIQYNLDRHGSVAEVLADAEAVRPMSRAPIHYLVADAAGDAAALEFLDGKLVVHRGAAMPVRALTNSTYSESVAAFERAKAKGEMPKSVSSLDRFVRAAMLAGGGNADPIARGLRSLLQLRNRIPLGGASSTISVPARSISEPRAIAPSGGSLWRGSTSPAARRSRC